MSHQDAVLIAGAIVLAALIAALLIREKLSELINLAVKYLYNVDGTPRR